MVEILTPNKLSQDKLVAPKKQEANLIFRTELLQKCADDVEFQAHINHLCEIDNKFFFNTFLWTYDPRNAPHDLPFITYDHEDILIDWIVERIDLKRDGHLDKTRDMGVTWTILGEFFHYWMFKGGFLAHLGSKTEDDVDRTGDMKSLFEKLRYFIRKMPSWMLPQHEVRFKRIVNYSMNNSITGESANKNWARQGRYKVVFYDEFAVTEYAEDIWTSAGDSSPSRIVVGTPNGTGTKFWRLRFKEMNAQDLMRLHWSLHPDKAKGIYKDKAGNFHSPWYDNECARRTPQEIAQELDIDYLASGNPFFDLNKVDEQKEWTLAKSLPKKEFEYELGILAKVSGEVKFRGTSTGVIMIFEHPSIITQAVVFSDPAEGLEHGDMSSIVVRCKKTGNLLAAVYGKIPPDELAEIEWLLSLYYKNALCTSEMGGYGLAVNQFLWEHGANTFRDVDVRQGGAKEGKKLGFNTKRHRAEMLRLAEEEIRNDACELRSRELKMECMNFVNKDGKPQAAEGSCDDFIFAWAGAGFLIGVRPYSKHKERNVINPSRIAQEENKKNMGFGFAGQVKKRNF